MRISGANNKLLFPSRASAGERYTRISPKKKAGESIPGHLSKNYRVKVCRLLKFQFVYVTAIGTAADTAVFGVGPFERMGTGGDGIGFLYPVDIPGDAVF